MLRLAHRGVGGLFVGGGDVKQDEPRPAAEPPGTEGEVSSVTQNRLMIYSS